MCIKRIISFVLIISLFASMAVSSLASDYSNHWALKDIEYLSAYWKSFETGTLEEHVARIVDGNAVFDTNHFSTYVLAESMTIPQEPEVEPGTPTTPDTPAVPSAPNTGANAKGLSSMATSLPLFGAIFAITGVAAVVFSKRK